VQDRLKLDRRRLESAHLMYAAMNVAKWYPESFSGIQFESGNIDKTTDELTPVYHFAFSKEYAGTLFSVHSALSEK